MAKSSHDGCTQGHGKPRGLRHCVAEAIGIKCQGGSRVDDLTELNTLWNTMYRNLGPGSLFVIKAVGIEVVVWLAFLPVSAGFFTQAQDRKRTLQGSHVPGG